MHFTNYQVDRGRLCDECEEAPYQQQHAFALSNSSLRLYGSTSLTLSTCRVHSFFILLLVHDFCLHCFLNDLTDIIHDMRIFVELRLSTRAASHRRIVDELDSRSGWPSPVLRATLYRILMKIDCFDKDNDAGNNNVGIQVRRRRCIDTDRYRVQT